MFWVKSIKIHILKKSSLKLKLCIGLLSNPTYKYFVLIVILKKKFEQTVGQIILFISHNMISLDISEYYGSSSVFINCVQIHVTLIT